MISVLRFPCQIGLFYEVRIYRVKRNGQQTLKNLKEVIMTGTLAQLISLVTYGNFYLINLVQNEFKDSNTTLQFCNMVHFIDYENKTEITISKSINDWFLFLKNDNVKYLKLHYQSEKINDRMLAGFVGGGGRWLIEAKKEAGSDFYEGMWKVTDPKNVNKKIWSVGYVRIAKNYNFNVEYPSKLNKIKNNLLKDLNEILKFAKENDITNFAKFFENGLNCLNSNKPFDIKEVYHKDLIPENYLNLEASQILAACHTSWVFGGMGSWNDMGFEGKKQKVYEKVSENLFKDINIGIVCAVNSVL
jgi:hypothetical protein